jgi:aspartyl-tRNA(Asn)/glutamyl-tRNA(Gln) amidotransferase subunit A
MTDLADVSAVALAGMIRRKQVSPTEVVQAALRRMEDRRDLNAFITETPEAALAEARLAEQRLMTGDAPPPLLGLPYSVKDLTQTAGVRTTMGSAIFENFVPKEDAVSVARARAAGAILIGKTTTPEFGHKQLTQAPMFGQTLNPVSPDHTCGASSGGAAAALRAGIGALALGTDGGGSIRIPAACCGVVGLKATLGVIPHLQVPDLFSANSFTGPMARDVADTRLFFNVLAGSDSRDPYGQSSYKELEAPENFKGLRVAYMPYCGEHGLDPEVAATTEAAVRRMEFLGARVETVLLDFVSLEQHFLVMLESAIASRISPHLEEFSDRLDPHLIETVEKGLRHSAVALQNAGAARTQTFRAVQALFEQVDLLISPVTTTPPLRLDERLPDGPIMVGGTAPRSIRSGWYPYTYPFNLTGHPALAMPCGISRSGLPIGLQLVGPWHADQRILGIAQLLETALG